MDATTILTEQHRKLEGLLKSALGSQQPEARSAALAKVGDDLTKHLTSEEEVFYPAIKARGTQDVLLESLEEHLSLKRLLADLLTLDPAEETWGAKLQVLDEQTRHHHEEEEEKLFPRAKKTHKPEELAALGQEILECQQQLQSDGAPREAVIEQTAAATPLR